MEIAGLCMIVFVRSLIEVSDRGTCLCDSFFYDFSHLSLVFDGQDRN